MAALPESTIAELLEPYLENAVLPPTLYGKLSTYLDLLLHWNVRTNLTAIRDPKEIVQRHFGESLFLGSILPAAKTLLDFGSGAGFPGVPVQLLRPALQVTLAESQGKKSSFLREVVRTLNLTSNIWAGRVEAMSSDLVFDIVAVRAVDKMEQAVTSAEKRVANGGVLALLTAADTSVSADCILIPGATRRSVVLRRF